MWFAGSKFPLCFSLFLFFFFFKCVSNPPTQGADGSIESQKLTLSQEQMLDFLATVKDANKQIERILTLN